MSKKILVIEDQPPIVKLLKNRLKAENYEVITAEDGLEGVEKAKQHKPDLIITDLALPKMTGNIIVRILKNDSEFKKIPIIMLSAFIRGTEKESVEVPADDYIVKPFESEDLIARVKHLLSDKADD